MATVYAQWDREARLERARELERARDEYDQEQEIRSETRRPGIQLALFPQADGSADPDGEGRSPVSS